ncbi:DNA replication/repair protein RecF [Lachnobacterium bovis]|uniref:DNA replication and repair protein RecF n=1 Tax=Lachnobacterium bovis TaxID=140626 RepID=A0A1H9UD35_9FIRM|nr:DNA replication/repair protein RecF [Lachnobacterium bovis]SES07365.1 DNA replication and repair protein RecF [Lachnobacterium bovis]
MIINAIELSNFRNYELLNLKLDKGTNIFFGDNAQGKTNILEAAYLSATTKSHRGSKDRELIKFKNDEAHIRTNLTKKDIPYRIDIHLKKNHSKGIALNQIPIKKASELYGIINMVFFSPEDLNIIKNGPAARRRFIDGELSQLDKIYMSNLSKYNKILMQRNRLLKEISFNPQLKDTLEIWDMQLVNCGNEIIKRREKFVKNLGQILSEIHKNISGGKEKLEIFYEADVNSDQFESKLLNNQIKDLKFMQTSVGPHRDDISFEINGIDVRKYGSQGQQRTVALSLKLAEIKLVEETVNDTPILLLDDVLSELDSNRQNYLLNSISNIQTLITCTGVEEFVRNRFEINKIFKVSNGTVEELENLKFE